jgi:hypothetical protein
MLTPAVTRDFSKLSFMKFSLCCVLRRRSDACLGSFIKLMRKNSVFSLKEGNNCGECPRTAFSGGNPHE